MSFSDPTFLFTFLPAVLAASIVAGRIHQRLIAIVLAVASLGFYSLWRLDDLPLLLASVMFNYAAGQSLLRSPRRWLLVMALAANIGALAFFKYTNFLISNVNDLFGASWTLRGPMLPLAVSFFTFQQVAYLADCYRRQVDRHGPLDYLLFVTFFPHLIAGPLVQPRDMLHQWHDKDLTPRLYNFTVGLSVFAIGLFKKVVIADALAPTVDTIFSTAATPGSLSTLEAIVGILGFAWQIYFDFSGYTDMAVGMAWLFGVRLPVNFDSPYRATSIIQFWQRWHITLSRFLREYLYIPLGGGRRGRTRRVANIMIVMLLGGLWHGAAWTFVAWGGLHGIAIVCNHYWRDAFGDRAWRASAWYAGASGVLTFALVACAWIPFRAPTWAAAQHIVLALTGASGTLLPTGPFPSSRLALRQAGDMVAASYGKPMLLLIIGAVIVFLLPNVQTWMRRADLWIFDKPQAGNPGRLAWRLSPAWGMYAGCVLFAALLAIWQTQTRPTFIYFKF